VCVTYQDETVCDWIIFEYKPYGHDASLIVVRIAALATAIISL